MSDDTTQPESPATEGKSRRLTLALSSLYLDPNNYRFIDHDDYVAVPDEGLADDEVQNRTRRMILGPNEEHVTDLIASFKQNGWLDVEPIHVRKFGERKYLVVEGNRRVATLKYLQYQWQESTGQLGKLDASLFDKVPCILYEQRDDFHHLVVMGLHHISGKRRWPALNQARLMKRLRDEFKKDSDEICSSLGVSKREFNLSLRTLALVDAYRKSDYGDQFTSGMFNLFREVLKAPALRTWLAWDNDNEIAASPANQDRLFSWLSREPDDDDEAAEGGGDGRDPVITTGGQIRELAKIIEDSEAVKRLEETRSLQAASLSSDVLVKNEIDGILTRCQYDVDRLFQLAGKMTAAELDRVDGLMSKMEAVAIARKRQPSMAGSDRPWQVYTELPQSHFHSVHVESYRALSGIQLDQLGRVNLLVGINNAGKTSTIEVVYLLASQSDPRALLEIVRRRTRVDPSLEPGWTVSQLPQAARITARFDSRADNAVSLDLERQDEPEDSGEDWASYVGTLIEKATYAGRTQRSVTDFFASRTRRTRLDGEPRWLCPAILHSPFSASDPELLVRCNEASIRAKSKDRVLGFIRSHLDAGITDIALANGHSRFLVTHRDLGEAVDLSNFGEGVQRIFQVGLLFAGARGGIVLIDEFENALHTGLLLEFTKFVHELAVEFDTQVFLTTHSKETVDAFLLNAYRTEEVVAFLLKRDEAGTRSAVRFDGPALKRAVEVGDIDLRRL